MRSSIFVRVVSPVRGRRLFWAVAFLFFCGASARAQTSTWVGGSGNWSSPGNWTPNGVPNSNLISVNIDGGNLGVNSVVGMDLASASVLNLQIDSGDTLQVLAGSSFSLDPQRVSFSVNSGTLNNNGSLTNQSVLGLFNLAGTITNNAGATFTNLGFLFNSGAGATINNSGGLANGG